MKRSRRPSLMLRPMETRAFSRAGGAFSSSGTVPRGITVTLDAVFTSQKARAAPRYRIHRPQSYIRPTKSTASVQGRPDQPALVPPSLDSL